MIFDSPAPKARTARRRNGFTLAEVMVSLVILSIGVGSMVGLLRFMMRTTQTNSLSTSATFLAQDKLETLLMSSFANMTSGSDTTGGIARAWTVQTVGTYKTISVTATWDGVDGMHHSYNASSIRNGP